MAITAEELRRDLRNWRVDVEAGNVPSYKVLDKIDELIRQSYEDEQEESKQNPQHRDGSRECQPMQTHAPLGESLVEKHDIDLAHPGFAIQKLISNFQSRVLSWVLRCIPQWAYDKNERSYRFFEEAVELVQAGGMEQWRCHAQIVHTFSRAPGDIHQESGGVSITHAAFCNAFGIDMNGAANAELKRINTPEIIEKVRNKTSTRKKVPVDPNWGGN